LTTDFPTEGKENETLLTADPFADNAVYTKEEA
jgi:hypothetical protein